MAFPAKYPSLNETALTDEARSTLIRVIRVAFPHDSFPDGPYERTADTILKAAEESTWFRVALTQGLLTLAHLAGGDFRDLDEDAATSVLRRIESTEFFGFIRRTTVLNLYDDPEVWEAVGYEGSSVEKGGYVDRGFNDLDWLPEPRIETYEGEPIVEIASSVPLRPTHAAHGGSQSAASTESDTNTQPGSTNSTAGSLAHAEAQK
ncbi:hypothetical protein [Frondihabitans cladoniiphilus]|uniref:Gluconate 2-dehydrogenase subunit 3-like protein n=1 Tax=Frondihabitans cladoniiphilus TaxID=715785 RepID=A0ABP8WBY6_9MICO